MLRGRIIAAPTGVNGFELNFHHLLSPDGKAVPIASRLSLMDLTCLAAAGGQSGAAPAATISVWSTADALVFLKGANLVITGWTSFAGAILRQLHKVVSGTSPVHFRWPSRCALLPESLTSSL